VLGADFTDVATSTPSDGAANPTGSASGPTTTPPDSTAADTSCIN
jgi:hypothetical protein